MLAVLTCLFISVATFAIIHLPPGDYISTYVAEMAASGSTITQDEAERAAPSIWPGSAVTSAICEMDGACGPWRLR